MTINKHTWGYLRDNDIDDYYTSAELIRMLVITVSCGGEILSNSQMVNGNSWEMKLRNSRKRSRNAKNTNNFEDNLSIIGYFKE